MEVSGYYGKRFVWEVVDNHVVEDKNDNYEIGIHVYDFNLFDEYKEEW